LGQLEPGGCGLVSGAYLADSGRWGNSWAGFTGLVWEVTVKGHGVAVTKPQGQSRAPSLSIETQ